MSRMTRLSRQYGGVRVDTPTTTLVDLQPGARNDARFRVGELRVTRGYEPDVNIR